MLSSCIFISWILDNFRFTLYYLLILFFFCFLQKHTMASANKEMAVYCFDTLVSHYNNEDSPPPAFDDANQYVSLKLLLCLLC